jgi:type IV pilus assembly protein PilC
MPTFNYKARDADGELATGTLDAESVQDAAQSLRAQGKFVVDLQAAAAQAVMQAGEQAKTAVRASGAARGKVKRDHVIHFTHQMAIMLRTGVPLGEALESIVEQAEEGAFLNVVSDVSENVHSGMTLSQAMARHPRVFPVVMISLLEASEASGTMGEMLERISQYLIKEHKTLKKVRGAMLYPLFMLSVAVLVTVFLLAFVMPRFAAIYGGRGANLPLPTQILLDASHYMVDYWHIEIGVIGLIVGLIAWARRSTPGRRLIDTLKLKTPVVGPLINQLYIARSMQTMGTMISAGVPMLDMIRITRNVTNNVHYQEMWDRVDHRIQQGAQLSEPLGESGLFPASITRMVKSGEKSSQLGHVMEQVAEFAEGDFDSAVERATQFIEPVMILFMGILIGAVAISLLLPIFSISKVVAG